VHGTPGLSTRHLRVRDHVPRAPSTASCSTSAATTRAPELAVRSTRRAHRHALLSRECRPGGSGRRHRRARRRHDQVSDPAATSSGRPTWLTCAAARPDDHAVRGWWTRCGRRNRRAERDCDTRHARSSDAAAEVELGPSTFACGYSALPVRQVATAMMSRGRRGRAVPSGLGRRSAPGTRPGAGHRHGEDVPDADTGSRWSRRYPPGDVPWSPRMAQHGPDGVLQPVGAGTIDISDIRGSRQDARLVRAAVVRQLGLARRDGRSRPTTSRTRSTGRGSRS
jgi:hypothetical protein